MNPSRYDLLLEYATIAHTGSWNAFRRAVSGVASKDDTDNPHSATSVAYHLTTLGHIEFAFDSTLAWSVSPTVIAGTPMHGEGSGVLCGARSRALVENLVKGAQTRGVVYSCEPQYQAPNAVTIRSEDTSELADLAQALDIAFEPDAAARLAACLPGVLSLYHAAPEDDVPYGMVTSWFDVEGLRWVPVAKIAREGSYFFDGYRPEYRVIFGGSCKKVSRSVGVYWSLATARRVVMEYDEEHNFLTIPVVAHPPVMHERTLVLCQGTLPIYNATARILCFANVSSPIAYLVRRALGQE